MFDSNDYDALAVAIDDLFTRSEIFKEYLRGYHDENEFENYVELIRATAVRVAGSDQVDDDILERALYLLIKSGRIRPKSTASAPLEETPVDTRPRDKNGKLLTDAQIAWGEMNRYANEHTSDECRKRAQTDEAFKKFMQTRLRQEMNAPIDGAVEAIGTVKNPVAASADVRQFAFEYLREKSENLRPKGGFITLAGKPMPYEEFKIRVDAAIAAGLI